MLPLDKITTINKILYLICLSISLWIIMSFLFYDEKRLDFDKKMYFIKKLEVELHSTKSLSYYVNLISNRDLFTPLVKEEEVPKIEVELPPKVPEPLPSPPKLIESPPTPPKPPEPKIPLDKRVANLVLIGVIFDEEGAVAIIQDSRRHHEYLLKKGDFIEGIKIEEILEDKVILKDGDEKVDLRL